MKKKPISYTKNNIENMIGLHKQITKNKKYLDKYIHNKSTQRVYIPLKKVKHFSLLPPPPSPSPRSHLLLFFLHNFLSFSLGKKKEFCLVLSHLALESTLLQSSLPSHFITSLLLSVRFQCAIRIWREFMTASVRRAFHVNVATNVTRRHM